MLSPAVHQRLSWRSPTHRCININEIFIFNNNKMNALAVQNPRHLGKISH